MATRHGYMVRFFDAPHSVSARQLRADLALLPQWRRHKALFYRSHIDQVLSARAYLLLRDTLREAFGYRGDIDFDYLAHGKPVLRQHPEMHFSLSHCHKGVMCVVADRPVGCDIEEIAPLAPEPALLHRCCSPAEAAGILAASDQPAAFARCWTMKEAVLKLTGQGMTDDLPQLLTPQLLSHVAIDTACHPPKGYACAVAIDKTPAS